MNSLEHVIDESNKMLAAAGTDVSAHIVSSIATAAYRAGLEDGKEKAFADIHHFANKELLAENMKVIERILQEAHDAELDSLTS